MLTMTICAQFLLGCAAASSCAATIKPPPIEFDHGPSRAHAPEPSVGVITIAADLMGAAHDRLDAAIARSCRGTRGLAEPSACGHTVIVAGNHLIVWVVLRSRGPGIEEVLT